MHKATAKLQMKMELQMGVVSGCGVWGMDCVASKKLQGV